MPRPTWLACAAFAALFVAGSASGAVLEPLNTFGGGDGYLAPGDRSYLPTGAGNNERGLAYNPVTNNLYIVSRTGGNKVAILNGNTGDEVGLVTLPATVTGGTFPVSQIRVANDGAIYIANLATPVSATQPFKIYRFADEAALQSGTFTVAYSGVPTDQQRFGDNLNIRGSGANTQILAGAGSAFNNLALLTTTDGNTFTAQTFSIPGTTTGDAANGVAFGTGNTIYAKQVGEGLRLFSFDPSGTALTLIQEYNPGGTTTPIARVGPIDVDPVTGLLAGVSIPTGVDSARLYDITNTGAVPVEQDFENFIADLANANVAGAIDLANGRVYALDTNNGVLALAVVPEPATLGLVGIGAIGLLARRRRG